MHIIGVMNQKGGVAKTTTVQAIGDYLQARGKRVLYVDLDPQSNLSYSIDAAGGAFETLLDPAAIENHITETERGAILAGSPALVGADAALVDVGKEYRLKEALSRVSYDYCIIDTAPSLGVLTINALTAADGVIIPVQADIFSLQGMGKISATITAVKQYTNTGLDVLGILITRNNQRTVIRRDIADLIEKHAAEMGTRVFNTRIRECTAVVEALAYRKGIFEYAPRSNAAIDYAEFMNELNLD